MSRFIDFNSNNKDTHTEDEGHRLRVRSTLLMVFFGCLLLGFFSILYQLQVVDGAQWRANANYNITQTETVDGVRGDSGPLRPGAGVQLPGLLCGTGHRLHGRPRQRSDLPAAGAV